MYDTCTCKVVFCPKAPDTGARMCTSRFQISVILTDECNLRCAYCTAPKRPTQIDTATVTRLLDLLEHAAPATVDLNLHGGEPLLAWEQVTALTEGVRERLNADRCSLNMSTNGTLLTADRARYLVEHGFNLRLSIDGQRRSHTRHRVTQGARGQPDAETAFDQTRQGLRHLIDAGANVAANMVVTPETVADLLRNAAYLVKLGIRRFSISPAIGPVWPASAVQVLGEQLQESSGLWPVLLSRYPELHGDLQRACVSEISRALYCLGRQTNHPGARVLVIGPGGEIYGDEPDDHTEVALRTGHLSEIVDLTTVAPPTRTAFQLMYHEGLREPEVLRSIRHCYGALLRQLTVVHTTLFGPLPELPGLRSNRQ